MSRIEIESVNLQELSEMIRASVRAEIALAQPPSTSDQEELLSYKQVADIFQKSRQTIHAWASKGILQPYGIESQVYFKRSEVLASLQKLSTK
ncbi:helix-turn-helix domain-containing protein [Flavobacterium selenitireducens]|uniref:helix-turn-helix domain-containing protein n=1 Tax=Flavobacterium selenitireducens TaxID=2722704 RepID=UPI00168AE9A2|nr:helix-turn-helix domain-containing protein [Flavobacterium selenitireducens]MBD3582747.1 helix-turn-helix domain-containing protein [Flavobacterium selenitireducens]